MAGRIKSFEEMPETGSQSSVRGSPKDKKIYASTFDPYQRQKLVQLLILSEKIHGFTCVIANPKPLFFP